MKLCEKLMMTLDMSNEKLSIIIVNYRSEQLLEKCLTSVFKKIKSISFEVIIVNNDKKEKLEIISRKYPEVKILTSPINNGFGAGNNLGAKEAQGEIILFLNPDTEIMSDNIEEVLDQFSKMLNLGVLSGCLISVNGKIEKWSAGQEISLYNLILNNIGFSKSKKNCQSQVPSLAEWVSGTALFIKRETFLKLKGFDEGFFMYFEDMDLCKRVRNIGQKVVYYPQFRVQHKNGESYSKNKKQQKKDYYKAQEYYFKKHYNGWKFWMVRFLGKFF